MFERLRTSYLTVRLRGKQFSVTPEQIVPRESYHLYTARLTLVRPLPAHCRYDFESDEIVGGIAIHFLRQGFTVKTQRMNRRRFETVPFAFSEAIGDIGYVYPDINQSDEIRVRVSKTGRTDFTLSTGNEIGTFPLLAKIATEDVWLQANRLIVKSPGYLNTEGVCADTLDIRIPDGWDNLVDLTILGWV